MRERNIWRSNCRGLSSKLIKQIRRDFNSRKFWNRQHLVEVHLTAKMSNVKIDKGNSASFYLKANSRTLLLMIPEKTLNLRRLILQIKKSHSIKVLLHLGMEISLTSKTHIPGVIKLLHKVSKRVSFINSSTTNKRNSMKLPLTSTFKRRTLIQYIFHKI